MGLLAEARTLRHHGGPIKINPTGRLVHQPTVISYTVILSRHRVKKLARAFLLKFVEDRRLIDHDE